MDNGKAGKALHKAPPDNTLNFTRRLAEDSERIERIIWNDIQAYRGNGEYTKISDRASREIGSLLVKLSQHVELETRAACNTQTTTKKRNAKEGKV